MARCDQGYLCRVCGEEVEHITDSQLYLSYVIGEVDPETLHQSTECHLNCSPAFAQFISDPRFCLQNQVASDFAKNKLDPEYVSVRTSLVSRGYARLWAIREERRKPLTVVEYPLPEFSGKWR
jgi:hypothetical protein